jgi:hypothetical protein
MATRHNLRSIALGVGLIAAALVVDGWLPIGVLVGEAQAVVGRPMTPGSVAGVARRTTRRTIRRTAVYASTLPRGCTTVIIEGTSLYRCGGTYYQSSGSQYVVVNVD